MTCMEWRSFPNKEESCRSWPSKHSQGAGGKRGEQREKAAMKRGTRGARDQGVCLGVESMESNRPQWSPHRKQAMFPRKEHPGMLNTQINAHYHITTHTHAQESHCFRMRSINLWLDPDPGCWCELWLHMVWHRLYLPHSESDRHTTSTRVADVN